MSALAKYYKPKLLHSDYINLGGPIDLDGFVGPIEQTSPFSQSGVGDTCNSYFLTFYILN